MTRESAPRAPHPAPECPSLRVLPRVGTEPRLHRVSPSSCDPEPPTKASLPQSTAASSALEFSAPITKAITLLRLAGAGPQGQRPGPARHRWASKNTVGRDRGGRRRPLASSLLVNQNLPLCPSEGSKSGRLPEKGLPTARPRQCPQHTQQDTAGISLKICPTRRCARGVMGMQGMDWSTCKAPPPLILKVPVKQTKSAEAGDGHRQVRVMKRDWTFLTH